MKRKRIVIIFICFLCVFGIASIFLLKQRANIKVDYCKSIGKEIENLRLEQFQLNIIDYGDTQEYIIFHFGLKDKSKFDHDECINDISLVRNTAAQWLNDNISSELNNKNVAFIFQTLPGDSISMFNYNNKERLVNPAQFQFFSCLNVNASAAIDFIDAKIIDIRINENDRLDFLIDFKSLEQVYLNGKNLTKDEKEYLNNILPDCVIICNGVTISDVKSSDSVLT